MFIDKFTYRYPDGLDPNMGQFQAEKILELNHGQAKRLLKYGYIPDWRFSRVCSLSQIPFIAFENDVPIYRIRRINLNLSDDEFVQTLSEYVIGDSDEIMAARFIPIVMQTFIIGVLEMEEVLERLPDKSYASSDGKERIPRHRYRASLAGRVRDLGNKEMTYIGEHLSDEESEYVSLLLYGRVILDNPGVLKKYIPKDLE